FVTAHPPAVITVSAATNRPALQLVPVRLLTRLTLVALDGAVRRRSVGGVSGVERLVSDTLRMYTAIPRQPDIFTSWTRSETRTRPAQASDPPSSPVVTTS